MALPSTVTLREATDSLAGPASRFRKPWRWRERARLMLSQAGVRWGVLENVELPVASPVPLHWQPIFSFLYREGVIERPGFDSPAFRNDMPKTLSVAVRGVAGGTGERVTGHASGRDADETISKALGEFLERYSAAIVDRGACTRASIAELERRGTRFLDPRTLCRFSADQVARFEGFRYSAATPFHWVTGTELLSGQPHFIPAQLAQYPFRAAAPDEPILNPHTSNGMAGHFSREEAILAGLKELVQRDAFLIYWLNALTPRRIDVADVPEAEFQRLVAYARAHRTELHFLDLRTDLPVPTAVCIAVARRKDGPIVTVGAGNGATALQALERAYFEAIPALSLSAVPQPVDPAAETYMPFADPKIGKLERITLWRGEEWLARLGFWLDGPLEPFAAFAEQFARHRSPSAELHALTEAFRRLGPGYGIYVHTMENPIIEALGYHAVQVRVPKLVPMYLNEHQAPLEAERLSSVPAALGLTPGGRTVFPHPFP
ncbi:MAG: YcaO-like family protein [Enhydrobacter sp.]|nr:MAG: YcaO-like family protein [Enhydrobacter sp.]